MKLILGSMTFSDQVDQKSAADMVRSFVEAGHTELDTAYVYNKGKTEELLGSMQDDGSLNGTNVSGKANPAVMNGLSPVSIEHQITTSLKRLRRSKLDIFYLHLPDLDTPIEDTLAETFNHYQNGRFERFGLSNYASWQVAEIAQICKQRGWMQPVVYQGMYNALTRDVERELFPCLANYGIAFYVYNPLAGGMLSGKHHRPGVIPTEGRFATFEGYQDRYWKASYFDVIQPFVDACKAADITPAAAALRWLIHHSSISPGSTMKDSFAKVDNGIILGASSLAHFEANLAACSEGPLPTAIVEVLDAGWDVVRPTCIKYFRP